MYLSMIRDDARAHAFSHGAMLSAHDSPAKSIASASTLGAHARDDAAVGYGAIAASPAPDGMGGVTA